MDILDDIFFSYLENYFPSSREYSMREAREARLAKQLRALDKELMEQYLDAIGEREYEDCKAFFRQGLRLGVDLLRL